MTAKNLFYSLLLCLVFMVAAACSPAAGPEGNERMKTMGMDYDSPSGFYDDDRGYKDDFQLSDLNPNMVTGTNDLYDLERDSDIIAQMAASVNGVKRAVAHIHGGTAHVNLILQRGARKNREDIRSEVYQIVKAKMPRYRVHVEIR